MKERRGAQSAIAWSLRIVVVLAVAAVWFLQPFVASNQTRDTARISNYDVDMVLSRDGDLSSVETIETWMPSGKRGIFKIFDETDPRRSGVEHPVEVESITRDGSPEPYTDVDGAAGTRNVRIGEESVILEPGAHTYEVRSRTTDVFEPGDDGETLWWWDVVGSGWQMEMDRVEVRVDLPVEPIRVECVQGEDTECDTSVEGTTLTGEHRSAGAVHAGHVAGRVPRGRGRHPRAARRPLADHRPVGRRRTPRRRTRRGPVPGDPRARTGIPGPVRTAARGVPCGRREGARREALRRRVPGDALRPGRPWCAAPRG